MGISYADADALIRAVGLALERLCPMHAAWALLHLAERRFGRAAAVAAAAGALMCACGRRASIDDLLDCAERMCGGGPGVRISDADAVAAAAREVGGILGLHSDEAARLAGLLRYRFLQLLGAPALELSGREALWGELIAYACRIRGGGRPAAPQELQPF